MEDKKKSLDKLGEFLASHGKWVIAFFVTVCLAVFALVLLNVINHRFNQKAQVVAEALEDAYDSYLSAKNLKETKPNAFANRTLELNRLLEQYKSVSLRRYSGFRYSMIQAALEKEKGNPLEAAAILARCGKQNPHPLAPVLLLEAAALYENGDDWDQVFALISLVVKKSKKSPFWSRAVFNLGRLYEEKEEFAKAEAAYAKIADLETEEASSYAALAQSRLIALEIKDHQEREVDEE